MLCRILAQYRAACPSGSYLALSHLTADDSNMDMPSIASISHRSTHPAHPRTKAEFRRLFTGTDLVDPGIVWVHEWHNPDVANAKPHHGAYDGLGRIP